MRINGALTNKIIKRHDFNSGGKKLFTLLSFMLVHFFLSNCKGALQRMRGRVSCPLTVQLQFSALYLSGANNIKDPSPEAQDDKKPAQ